MRRWWKTMAEAWLRHALPMDMDPFRPFAEEPRRPGGTPLSRLDPGDEARPARPGRPDPDWAHRYPPPAA
jgi:hypothetical protein